MQNLITLPCGAKVERAVKLLSGNKLFTYTAYRRTNGPMSDEYSSIKTFDGEWYGDVSSRRLSAEVDAMSGDERIEAVMAEHERNNQHGYTLILKAYPHLDGPFAATTRALGSIDSWE